VDNQEKFDTLYSDLAQPGAYTQKIKLYLRKNETHSLHRPKRKKFPRRSIITHYPGQIIQSDLIDMQKYSTNNNGFNYILVVIDCFSKYLWCIALKNKSAFETSTGLRTIFSKMKYPVQTIIFDQGLEYVNLLVNNLLKERGIHSYHILTKNKASSAERVNQTIKKTIWKLFTIHKNKKWVKYLDDIVSNYNDTYHRTIEMPPAQVTWANKNKVFKIMFPNKSVRINCRLKIGDEVRIALNKNIFEKGFTQNWSKDIFIIVKVFQKNGVCWYRLKDKEGYIYSKTKYFYELNQV
jgi:L-rhamnose mutarotase